MKDYKYEYILAIAEERNITNAAKKLYISQPALTLALTRLERELGVKLFNRETSPIKITLAGELYIHEMKKIIDLKDRLAGDLLKFSVDRHMHINLGIGANRGINWLPKIIPEFNKLNPESVIHVVESSSASFEQQLINGTIDIAITTMLPLRDEIDAIEICSEDVFLVVSKNHPILKGYNCSNNSVNNPLVIDHKKCNGHTFITASPSRGLYRAAQFFLTHYNIEPKNIMHINNSTTSFKLACNNVGITFSTNHYIMNFEDTAPIYCTFDKEGYSRKIYAIIKKGAPHSYLIDEIINISKRMFS